MFNWLPRLPNSDLHGYFLKVINNLLKLKETFKIEGKR